MPMSVAERRSKSQFQAWVYWVLPPLVSVILYWACLTTWFRSDDFAWLAFHQHLSGWRELLSALFAPAAQGTIRPWSERLFFLAGFRLFGLHALPFHIVLF